jgi:uncharacterized membrane protein
LRLSSGSAYRDELPTDKQAAIPELALPENVRATLLKRCSKCHEQLASDPAQLLSESQWLRKEGNKTRMEQKIFDDELMPMPPDKSLLPDERQLLKNWFTGSSSIQ